MLNQVANESINRTQDNLSAAMVRLSTAQRINRAQDDAAGQAITNAMQSELRSNSQASRNLSDALSLTATAGAALDQAQDVVQRMRELALQANKSTTAQSDRQSIQQEIAQLNEQLQQLADSTRFNGQRLLDGQFRAQIQSGPEAGDTKTIALKSVSPQALQTEALDVGQRESAAENLRAIDSALAQIDDERANIGAAQGAMASRQANLRGVYEKLANAKSQIADTDFAKETREMQRQQLSEAVAAKALSLYKSNAPDLDRLLDTRRKESA